MAIHPTHRVASTALNLRSEPQVRLGNRIAVLPSQQAVEKLDEHDSDWWRVAVELHGADGEGFVASRFLETHPVDPVQLPEAPEVALGSLPQAHLAENRPDITRAVASGRAFPLGEPLRPGRTSDDLDARALEVSNILDWLDVENSLRYQPTTRSTFCNIYAHDVCYLANAYLPRVWWTGGALLRIRSGETVPVLYGKTVEELNANSLLTWLADFGAAFGWHRTLELNALQEAANQGAIGIIVARHQDANRSGHIAVVEREGADLEAARTGAGVTRPITSQAGRRNHRRQVPPQPWWSLPPHSRWTAWIHD